MKVAVGQFRVTEHVQQNAESCVSFMADAAQSGADMLVLPEALLACKEGDPSLGVKSAQHPDGEYLCRLLSESRKNALTTILTLHVPTQDGRATNTLFALRNGEIIAQYQKLHLYDAFDIQESRLVDQGCVIPPLIDVAGMKVGLMTCYDLRFPELALTHALNGAEVLVLPAAWVRGPLKEHHWQTLLAARALDTTCWIVASGECGKRNIGQSRVVDPLGVTVASAAEEPTLFYTQIDVERVHTVRARLPVLANRRFASPVLL